MSGTSSFLNLGSAGKRLSNRHQAIWDGRVTTIPKNQPGPRNINKIRVMILTDRRFPWRNDKARSIRR